MNITKLPSGHYRIRQTEKGTTYSLTVDHKPTKTEALTLISKVIEKPITKYTLVGACGAYLGAKSNVLSITTIKAYKSLICQISPTLGKRYITDITKAMIQAEINDYSLGRSPKTTRNFGMFLTTVLDFFGNEIKGIQYPQKDKIEKYIPTPGEVSLILNYFKDTRFFVPIFLGVRGLRLSEVCGLTIFDLKDTTLTINKAKVRGQSGYVVKKPKTTDSERSIIIPEDIADRIRQQGFIYEGSPHIITRNLQKCQKELGITPFTFHQLRHFFASYTHYQGFVDKAIQDDAGWRTDYVMKNTYRQGMSKEEMSKAISDSIYAIIS